MKQSLAAGHAALLLGAASLVPMPGAQQPAWASETATKAPFAIPLETMVLTRTLRRPLPDGKEIISSRSYEVRFVSEANGFRIEGRLLSVDVKAPEALAMLVSVEKDRPDSNMFPLRLDRTGMLLVSSSSPDNAALQKAVELALGELANSRMVALEMLSAQAFVQQVRNRAGFNQWPEDLFHPTVGRQTLSRQMPLPNGVTGNITIDTIATTQGRGGLLASYARTVTTNLNGDERKTFEEWSLTPAGKN
jgi:hypothetical protein